jgi:carbamoyltransferase
VIRQHSIHNIAFSGGVALNVKAMQYLSALNIVHSIVVPPSASDESHIIGSIAAHVLCNSNELTFDKSFSCIPYYGPRPATSVLPDITEERCCGTRYEHVSFSRDTITHLAELAASGKILSTCRGNSEFGARALGNRSLLISPNNIQLREKLNTAIKSRDFWMPFAPVILVDYAHLYIELPDIRKINNRFMTQTYKLTPLGSELLQSASHQGDLTARAQIITRDDNSFLYSLIYEYGRITGTYGFLNTSFNTHGSPIVNTLDDALDIFFSTDIDILIADSFYLKKL